MKSLSLLAGTTVVYNEYVYCVDQIWLEESISKDRLRSILANYFMVSKLYVGVRWLDNNSK